MGAMGALAPVLLQQRGGHCPRSKLILCTEFYTVQYILHILLHRQVTEVLQNPAKSTSWPVL